MAEGTVSFPYTPVPGSLRKILAKIPSIGTPTRATQTWLAGIGFSGGNNRRNLAVMRQVGIISADGTPTDLWKAIRTRDKPTFAEGIRKHYADLFSTYPDADRKDSEALVAYVRSVTDYGEKTQKLAVTTFKVFCEFGDFGSEASAKTKTDEQKKPEKEKEKEKPEPARPAAAAPVGLTVNIQLQLPPSGDGEVYDKLFSAMAKHLKGLIQPTTDDS